MRFPNAHATAPPRADRYQPGAAVEMIAKPLDTKSCAPGVKARTTGKAKTTVQKSSIQPLFFIRLPFQIIKPDAVPMHHPRNVRQPIDHPRKDR